MAPNWSGQNHHKNELSSYSKVSFGDIYPGTRHSDGYSEYLPYHVATCPFTPKSEGIKYGL